MVPSEQTIKRINRAWGKVNSHSGIAWYFAGCFFAGTAGVIIYKNIYFDVKRQEIIERKIREKEIKELAQFKQWCDDAFNFVAAQENNDT